ncbi:MAG: Toluene efflux pump outer membrane protein TtgI [Chlamydiae bacterium]|nr:Toluene efflux pump outer membrane protein TtgI [Chlamydiota bacterium]
MIRWLFLLFLAGCTLGPDHCPPEVCMPERFKEEPELAEKIDYTDWWKQFNDPLLDTLIDEALCCNLDLRIALRRIEEVRGLFRIDSSRLFPQISGNMVAIRSRRSANLTSDIIESTGAPTEIFATDFTGALIDNFFQVGFDAIWELDFFGRNRKRAEAAFHDFEATQEEALFIQVSLLSDVARNYIEICTLQRQILIQKEQIVRSRELLELAESRYAAGLTSYVDVQRATAALETRTSELPLLQEARGQTIHALAVLLGCPPESFLKRFDTCNCVPIAMGRIPSGLPSELLCRRPDIRRADRELAAATARIGEAKADFFPQFSLTGSFGSQSNLLDKLFVWPSRFWSIGPSMVWELFTGGRLVAQVKVANERQKQAILNYEKVIYEAFQEVEDRLLGFFKEEERLESLEEKVAANSELRDLLMDQYCAGLISLDDVLRAENDLFLSQQEMVFSTRTLMVQLVGLYKALGGGWDCCDLQ